MRYVLICGVVSGVALVSWVLAGRRLVTVLDRIGLARVEQRGVDRLIYDAGTLDLDGKHVDLLNPAFARVAEVSLRFDGRVVLESGGRQFPMGPGRPVLSIGGRPKFEFTKDESDNVLFTVAHSRLAWPTPFEMNFMTGYAASRKRYVYLRLHWTKFSGAKLDMWWKAEQGYYRRDGWLPPSIESVTGGLIHVDIQDPTNSGSD